MLSSVWVELFATCTSYYGTESFGLHLARDFFPPYFLNVNSLIVSTRENVFSCFIKHLILLWKYSFHFKEFHIPFSSLGLCKISIKGRNRSLDFLSSPLQERRPEVVTWPALFPQAKTTGKNRQMICRIDSRHFLLVFQFKISGRPRGGLKGCVIE